MRVLEQLIDRRISRDVCRFVTQAQRQPVQASTNRSARRA